MRRPNILFVAADQHRGDGLRCCGDPCVQTQYLDRLVNEGVRFSNAYSDAPIGTPARTTMITGMQSHTYGCPSYRGSHRIDLRRKDFLGSMITRAGYHTHLIGKTCRRNDHSLRAGFERVQDVRHLAKSRRSRPDATVISIDQSDMHDLGNNGRLLEEYRNRLVDQLLAEGHEHVNPDRSPLTRRVTEY